MFACKNCGGNVKFDIKSGQLACEYCHSLFDPYAYEDKTSDAEVQKDFEATIFTCPQCGGEILSTDDTAAGFCSFCGASTVLYSRMQKEHKPAYIIPFAKSKDDCKQAYMSLMKKAIFVPKELKDPKFIDGFRGIYMPYWTYYVTQKAPISLPAKKSHRSGDYIITDHFRLEGDLDAYYKGLSYDASSSFDDSISEKLAPYDVKNMKRFTPAFLSGFYADTADLPSTVYASDAMDAACTNTVSEISKEPAFTGLSVDSDSAALSPLSLGTTVKETDYSMFPVWFLSYRNKDRWGGGPEKGQKGRGGELPLLGHHVIFDFSFLKRAAVNRKYTFEHAGLDTLKICRHFMPEEEKKNLAAACRYFSVDPGESHRALSDALAAHHLYQELKNRYFLEVPEVFAPQPLIYKVKREQSASKKQKEVLRELLKYHRINLSAQIDSLSKNEISRLTDQIIAQHGRMQKR